MDICTSPEEMRALDAAKGPTVVVMTMGALHAGHTQLMDVARGYAGTFGRVVVTIFVNPRQFGPTEDFDSYPRTFTRDLQLCEEHEVDVVFAPDVEQMYSSAETGVSTIAITAGDLGEILEGVQRPGHFDGMLTIVAKLFHLTEPNVALFGEKDYQQLVLIRGMVHALDWPLQVVGVPTVRDDDGLACSSRNKFLSKSGRSQAAAVPQALQAGVQVAHRGIGAIVRAVTQVLHRADLVPDYVEVRGVDLSADPITGEARLLIAVPVEGVRLIDNTAVDLGGHA
jgi:pantoate--beta-alanine ligase